MRMKIKHKPVIIIAILIVLNLFLIDKVFNQENIITKTINDTDYNETTVKQSVQRTKQLQKDLTKLKQQKKRDHQQIKQIELGDINNTTKKITQNNIKLLTEIIKSADNKKKVNSLLNGLNINVQIEMRNFLENINKNKNNYIENIRSFYNNQGSNILKSLILMTIRYTNKDSKAPKTKKDNYVVLISMDMKGTIKDIDFKLIEN